MNSPESSPARWWWVAGAAVLAAFYLNGGIENLVGEYAPQPGAAAQCFIYLAILVAGIACRVKAPRVSGALIAMGALPTLLALWAPPLLIFGLAVAVGALIEVARRSAGGARMRAAAVVGGVLLGVGAIAPMLGLISDPAIAPVLPTALGVIAVAAGATLLLVTRSSSHTATPRGAPTPEPRPAPESARQESS